MNYLKLLFLFIISFPFFSRAWGVISKLEHPSCIVSKVITLYRNHYGIDMKFYEGDIEDYRSLASFFTRKLDSVTRPLIKDENSFLSPCDGVVTVLEKVNADVATQVKGKRYLVSELVRKELDFSEGYYLVTIYLSPKDYHRYHVPVDSHAKSYIHTGWRLFPVNSLSVNTIDNLFVKNERIAVKFERDSLQYFFVAVGATFVGSVKMDFFDTPVDGKWTVVGNKYKQNQELGMFEMGSTIVLVIPEKMVGEPLVAEGEAVNTSQPLFKMKKDLREDS